MNEFVVVYSAELMRRLKSRPFQIGLLIGLVGIFVLSKLPGLMASSFLDNGSHVVVAGDPALTTRAAALLKDDFDVVATPRSLAAPDAAALKAHDADLWIAVGRDASGLRLRIYAVKPHSNGPPLVARDLAPLNVDLATRVGAVRSAQLVKVPYVVTQISSKFASSNDAALAWGVGYTLIMFLYVLILVNSQLVMSSVAEEKTSRIAELLVASISPIPLLYGKIASAATLAIVQMVAWILFAALLGSGARGAAAGTGGPDIGTLSGSLSPGIMLAFIALFVIGFLQLSLLFAAVGSLINRTEDLGSISAPLVLPVVGALFVSMAALGSPDASWVVAVSFVPIFSPFVLFARIAMSVVPVWQLVVAFGINILAVWLISLLAGKLYRVGMLLYGRAPSVRQIWSVLRS